MNGDTQVMLTDMGKRIGVEHWQLDRLCTRGVIPFERIGRYRVVRLRDADVIRAACRAAGYLREELATA